MTSWCYATPLKRQQRPSWTSNYSLYLANLVVLLPEREAPKRPVACAHSNVYTLIMTRKKLKNITLSIDANILDQVRSRARLEGTTANEVVRRMMAQYADPASAREAFRSTMMKLDDIHCERTFSRDELHER